MTYQDLRCEIAVIVTVISFLSQVIEAVVKRECQEVLINEMVEIKVEFKLYEEFNKLAEKTEIK